MASIYDIKPAFQNLLRPLCRSLAKAKITANQVTLSAVFLSAAAGAAILWFRDASAILLILPPVLFVRMALNAIDGMLAREFDMKSNLGAVLNELGDVVSDAVLYAPFAVVGGVNPWLVGVIVVLSIISEMTGVVGIQIGASRRYDGPMGKSDRAFCFGLLGLLLGLGVKQGMWLHVYLGAMAALVALTIFNRARKAIQEVA